MLEIAESELAAWAKSPTAVDQLRHSHPLLVVDDDLHSLDGPASLSGVIVAARPNRASDPLWGARADVFLDASIDDPMVDLEALAAAVALSPMASVALVEVLRVVEALPPDLGLISESAMYSMLQSGEEHRRWLAGHRRSSPPHDTSPEPGVLINRIGDEVQVTFNRPLRHNAYGTEVRDGLIEALQLAIADDSISEVVLRGAGRSFCSGGDLDEFGLLASPATGHRIRTDRSAAHLLRQLRNRLRVEVHGACIGAGIELAAIARHVAADPSARFALPEVSMGLIPGAGGTVSVSHRIGRQRTALWAVTGITISAAEALAWGLIDAVTPIDNSMR